LAAYTVDAAVDIAIIDRKSNPNMILFFAILPPFWTVIELFVAGV
jgi:hypothetical protein